MNELAQTQALATALILSGPILLCLIWLVFIFIEGRGRLHD